MPGARDRTYDDVLTRIGAIERDCLGRGDRRSVFATLYGLVSAEIWKGIQAGHFEDGAWVHRYGVAFADLYFEAYDKAVAGRTDDIPKAWRLCFDANASGRTLVLQDLLLGVNAHINHDLPFALVSIGIDPQRESRHRDHLAVNAILQRVTQRATDRLTALYAPGLATMDEAAGQVDEVLGQFSIEVARDNAWESALSLHNARTDGEQRLVGAMIGSRAAVLARLLRSASLSPSLIAICRRLEDGTALRALLA